MSIRIVPIAQQGSGAFNGGEIVENKPIGFPQDHSSVRPYSNLFYWAHAKGMTDSTIGLHPHQGFEILSFVLKGQIRHYDTKLREWRPLEAGDVQIIRAGNGISHSEWLAKDSEIFQIWFDPNLEKTLEKPASYDDYKADQFPVEDAGNTKITTMIGGASPFQMDTPGIEVYRFDLSEGSHTFSADPSKVYSAYVLDGKVSLNGSAADVSDFVLLNDQQSIELQSDAGASVFVIASPTQPGYRTYGQLRGAGH